MMTSIFNLKRAIIVGTLMILSLSKRSLDVDAAFMSSIRTSSSSYRSSTITQTNSNFMGRGMKLQQASLRRNQNNNNQRRGTTLGMFLGSDGILGVGAPEIVSIFIL